MFIKLGNHFFNTDHIHSVAFKDGKATVVVDCPSSTGESGVARIVNLGPEMAKPLKDFLTDGKFIKSVVVC